MKYSSEGELFPYSRDVPKIEVNAITESMLDSPVDLVNYYTSIIVTMEL